MTEEIDDVTNNFRELLFEELSELEVNTIRSLYLHGSATTNDFVPTKSDIDLWMILKTEGGIDYVYCSHVLEHLDNPVAAANEIIRVAKRGFVEVPNIAYELFFGGDEVIHKTVCDYDPNSNTLNFRKLRDSERLAIKRRKDAGDWFREQIKGGLNGRYKEAYFNHQDLFTICFIWEDEFNISQIT